MGSSPPDTQRAILLVALLGFIGLWLFNAKLGIEPLDRAELMRQRDLGIAQLESGDYVASNQSFSAIAARLPEDRLGPHNLVVSSLLALRQASSEERDTALHQARRALDALERLGGNEAVVGLMRGRLEMLAGNPATALEMLKSAAQRPPATAAQWYELYTVAKEVAERQELAQQALERAFAAAPDNLAILTERLRMQIKQRDPVLATTLDNALTLLAPFAGHLSPLGGAELESMVRDTIRAVDAENWIAAELGVSTLVDVVQSAPAIGFDRERLLRYELDLVVRRFTSNRMQTEEPTPARTHWR